MENTYTWVYNIIESCNKDFHFDCADVLITLFNTKCGDAEKVSGLKSLRQYKWDTIHTILL
ncbi:MAG: hypothetical protein ABI863_19975 [Ginsengibacter sp.]